MLEEPIYYMDGGIYIGEVKRPNKHELREMKRS